MLAIPLSFIFLACLILWLIVGSRGSWGLKLCAMLVTVGLAYSIARALSSYFGHPKSETMQSLAGKKVELIWVKISEPEGPKDSGAVYLWVSENTKEYRGWMDYQADKEDPESIKLPYSRPLHESAQEALTKIVGNGGEPIEVGFASKEPGYGQSDQRAEGHGSGGGMTEGQAEMYILPPAKPPQKPYWAINLFPSFA